MTPILLAANTAWIGLVIALWTKRLWETHYARFDCLALRSVHPPKGGKRMNHMTGKIAAILAATTVTAAAVLAFAGIAPAQTNVQWHTPYANSYFTGR
jgi:hypothetical protein